MDSNNRYSGGYPTRYGALSGKALLSLFGTSGWNGLSYEQRMDACQEVANRYAAVNNAPATRVTASPITGKTYGYERGNTVTLNEHLVRDGVFKTEDVDEHGKEILVDVPVTSPNWNTLDTVFHEGTHALQESQNRMADTYIDPEQDYDLYRIQHDEKEAFAAGQHNTLQAINLVERTNGQPDPGAAGYYTTVRNESFRAALQSAATHYNDPNIEATLAQVIYDRDHGIRQANPSPSYAAINSLCDQYGIQSGRTGVNANVQSGQENGNTAETVQPGAVQGAEQSGNTQDQGTEQPNNTQSAENAGSEQAASSGAGTSMDDGGSLSFGEVAWETGIENDGGSLVSPGQEGDDLSNGDGEFNDGGSLDADNDYDGGQDADGQDSSGQDID